MEEDRTENGVPAASEELRATGEPAAQKPDEEQMIEPENALPEVTLEDLPESLRAACVRAGWMKLLPVQARAIPYVLAGRNVMVQSQTGSGKTGAFILPILERIDAKKNACQALVLVPTRELAQQVARETELLRGDRGVRTAVVYGGVAYGPQLDAFRAGAQVVVGTPGRILDHLLKGTLNLDALEILVFDEADRMLSMGFYPDMKRVQQFLPRRAISLSRACTHPRGGWTPARLDPPKEPGGHGPQQHGREGKLARAGGVRDGPAPGRDALLRWRGPDAG